MQLPASLHTQAAARARLVVPAPGQDISGVDPTGLSFLMAFGDVSDGELKVGLAGFAPV